MIVLGPVATATVGSRPFCGTCGVEMNPAGSCFACPSLRFDQRLLVTAGSLMAGPKVCSACGAELRLRPHRCPLCGAEVGSDNPTDEPGDTSVETLSGGVAELAEATEEASGRCGGRLMKLARIAVCLCCAALLFSDRSLPQIDGSIRLAATESAFLGHRERRDICVQRHRTIGSRCSLAPSGARAIGKRHGRGWPRRNDSFDARASTAGCGEGNAGMFVARIPHVGRGDSPTRSRSGAYFQLGFHCEDSGDCAPIDPVVVFVRRAQATAAAAG